MVQRIKLQACTVSRHCSFLKRTDRFRDNQRSASTIERRNKRKNLALSLGAGRSSGQSSAAVSLARGSCGVAWSAASVRAFCTAAAGESYLLLALLNFPCALSLDCALPLLLPLLGMALETESWRPLPLVGGRLETGGLRTWAMLAGLAGLCCQL